MSVKLLSCNARELVLEFVKELKSIHSQILAGRHRAPADLLDTGRELLDGSAEFEAVLSSDQWQKSEHSPVCFKAHKDTLKSIFRRRVEGQVIIHRNVFYLVRGPFTSEEACLLVGDHVRKRRNALEYLRFQSESTQQIAFYERKPVPEEVRTEVWRRDRGRCVKCGSVYNLEFDHVIPVTKGGSNTARNIQLLCEPCNRAKSANI